MNYASIHKIMKNEKAPVTVDTSMIEDTTYFGMKVKSGVSRKNILAIFLIKLVTQLTFVDFMKLQVPLLTRKDGFNHNDDDASDIKR